MIPKPYVIAISVVLIAAAAGCAIMMMNHPSENENNPPDIDPSGYRLKITGPNGNVYADFADTTAARELIAALLKSPINVELEDYGSFEKVGDIGVKLTRSDKSTDTGPGDIVLYSGSKIVIFYGNNSWSYTRLAKVTDATSESMKSFLGEGDVSLQLSAETR